MNRELDLRIADEVLHIIRYRENDSTRAIIQQNSSSMYAMCEFKTIDKKHLAPWVCSECGTESIRWTTGKPGRYFTNNLPFYSSNIADAFSLAREMAKNGCFVRLLQITQNDWEAQFVKDGYPTIKRHAENPAAAICLAALAMLAEDE